MELVNKVFKAVVDGAEKDVAPATRSDNVYLASDQEKTIEEGLIFIYTHSKSGTVHEFTGTGPNGRALMTANVNAGDTFTVNGSPVTAYMGTEDAVDGMAGNIWSGKWITFVFDGETLNFKGGGGLSSVDKAKLIPENIRKGVTLFKGTANEVTGMLGDYTVVWSQMAYKDYTVTAYANQLLYDTALGAISGNTFVLGKSGRYSIRLITERVSTSAAPERHFSVNAEAHEVNSDDITLVLDLTEGDILEFYLSAYFQHYASALKCTMIISPADTPQNS